MAQKRSLLPCICRFSHFDVSLEHATGRRPGASVAAPPAPLALPARIVRAARATCADRAAAHPARAAACSFPCPTSHLPPKKARKERPGSGGASPKGACQPKEEGDRRSSRPLAFVGGETRIRTGDKGFAGLCLTTWPSRRMKKADRNRPDVRMERATGFEPATSTLARWRATNCAKPANARNNIRDGNGLCKPEFRKTSLQP